MQGQAQHSSAACDLQTHRLRGTRSRLGAFSNSGLPRPPSTGDLSQPDSLPIPCPALKEGTVGGREGGSVPPEIHLAIPQRVSVRATVSQIQFHECL